MSMDKCIVCGMEVEESTNLKTMYKGKIYRFCSEACKKAFLSDPEGYIKGGPKGMPGMQGQGHHHGHHEDHCC